MGRNLISFDIRRTRTPTIQGGLSSTMLVILKNRKVGYITIGFSYALVRFVGNILPRGISVHDPAYMSLVLDPDRDCYILYAQYLEDAGKEKSKRYVLFEIEQKPEWLRGVRKVV